ncbi:MAG: transglutaminase domain-containing protein [Bacteroidetes bacterium]|nr:transglutaminase domain-containing protein [Bacteroidota bacterium]
MKNTFILSFHKYLLAFLLLGISIGIYGQSGSGIELQVHKSDMNVPGLLTKHPVTLVNYLTKGKASDKEKFDAIFTWVATNIKYDFDSYYSSGGAGMPKVTAILKYKSGICLDYAYLMDTLCRLANITNVSVYGYAKDDIFDVNDSIYIDNHAWNAVNLDGLWYVYDVTWASGATEYKLTKFSAFIYNIYLKHPPKYKTKKVISKQLFTINYCDSALTKTPLEITYFKQRFWNRLLLKQLFRFKLKTVRVNNQKINPNYYLCNPEAFAINHFPDDPTWSLTNSQPLRKFECDSAFYHLNDSTYASYIRYGRPCPDCDGFLANDELNKQHILRKASLKFNPRNRFITTICEYNIGKLKYIESKAFEDSISKVTVIDTSLAYLSFAKESLLKSLQNIEIDNLLQKNKNKIKADILYAENEKHREFIFRDKFNTRLGAKSIKDLERKTKMSEKKLIRRINRIRNYDANEIANPKLKNTDYKLAELNYKLKQTDSIIDALDQTVFSLKQTFEKTVGTLSADLKQKLIQHDSAFIPFQASTYMRYIMKDNYKKEVVDVRKKINISEQHYLSGLKEKIYTPAALCLTLGDSLFTTITVRNSYEEFLFKIKAELVRRCQMPVTALKDYKLYLRTQNRQDICWIKTSTPNLNVLFSSFNELLNHQKTAESILKKENNIENRRFKLTNKELDRRKRKYKKIVLNNTKVVNFQTRVVRKEKREFLKKLRKERREAARKNR